MIMASDIYRINGRGINPTAFTAPAVNRVPTAITTTVYFEALVIYKHILNLLAP